jgi:hypothetical protein
MSDNKNEPRGKLDSTIVAAIITGVVTIIVTALTVFGSRLASPAPQPTATSPVVVADTATLTASPQPTDTVPPGEATSTPAPATDTPTATSTTVPAVALGEDWRAGCISTLWQPYPAEIQPTAKGNGCWQEPVFVYSAENGDLDFLAQNINDSTVYGLFAPLPGENGSVSFKVRLRDLTNADLLMGIYAQPDVTAQGLLMTIPAGNVKNRVIVQKDNVSSYTTMQKTGNLAQGDGYWFTFTYSLNSVRSTLNPSVFVTNPFSLPSAQKWLFLGYKVLNRSYGIEGTFFDLALSE